MSDWNKAIIDEFRANAGKVGGQFAGRTLLLLHTTGAKSGETRVNPLVTIPDGERYVIVASKSGSPTNPDWYYNLSANPEVTVEVGSETFQAVAQVTAEPERTRLYEKMESVNPGFTEYKSKTSRSIPVITLTRKA
jgi:deazaflavin-dependent oxidoreductase (nitroreductase family)